MKLRFAFVLLLTLLCSHIVRLHAQTPISSITTNSVTASSSSYSAVAPSDASNSVTPGTTYTMSYGNGNDLFLTSYTVGSITYDNFITPDTLILQRTDAGELINVFYELNSSITGTTIEMAPSQIGNIDAMYAAGLLNVGYVNLLVNNDTQNGDGSITDQVERIDIIYRTGLVTATPDNAIFPIVELGGNDAIKIAAITSLDANGEPASFGNLIAIEDADQDAGGITDWGDLSISLSTMGLRRQDTSTDPIPLLNNSTSLNLFGTAVSFSDLGVSAGDIIYGYSLFAYDVESGTHVLTDITTFPTNSPSLVSGLDLVAGISAAVASDENLTNAVGPGGYIESLTTWFKANAEEDITTSTDGSSVSDWQDHWTGNHDATTGRGTPTYRNNTTDNINFNPVVDFTSGTTSLGIANNNDFNTTTFTRKNISILFQTPASFTSREVIYEQGGASRGIMAYIDSDGTLNGSAWNRNNDGAGSPWNDGTIVTSSTSLSVNTSYILTMELDGSSTGTGSFNTYLNGNLIGTLSNVGLLYSHTGDIEIGASGGGTIYPDGSSSNVNPFSGSIAEFIYCNEPVSISSTTRQKTESYLAIKYGITLSQSSPANYYDSFGNTIFDATNTASIGGHLEYNNAIAGIGRDDNSELDQRKSKSESSGSILTVEKTSAFSDDDSWLIWGHDGGTTTTTTSDVPATVSQRLTREWRVAETNTNSETVDISFDLTGLSLSTEASEFSLLIAGASSGGDFTTANIITGGTLSSNILTFTNVSLMDKEYLALGTGFDLCSPGGISSGLKLWLRADKEVYNTGSTVATDGQTVNSWGDQSTSAADASDPSNLTLYQTNIGNYNPAVEFNNDVTSLEGSFTTITAGLTQFTAGFFNSSSGTDDALYEYTNGSDRSFFINSRYGGNTAYSTNITEDIWSIWSVDHPSGNTANIYENGAAFESSYSTPLSAVGIGTYNYTLGDDDTDGNDFVGFLGDVIAYEGTMSATERQQVETYLAIKYGVTLDQTTEKNYLWSDGTTVIWDASTNESYNTDLAGIGRDDASCLNQRQSRSVNTSAIVSMGLGSIASTNEGNTNNFTNDGDYLIWGHNGTSASTTQATDLPGTVTARLSRIWHVEETGDVTNTAIAFDLNGLGLSSTASDYQLIVSSSATMASGVTVPNGILDGNILTFSGIDFSDEDYFTLGTARSTCSPGGVSTDIELWLYAGQGTNTTTNGGNITSWSDQSGKSNNASQVNLGGSSIQQPTYQTTAFNFNPVIRFSDPNSSNGAYMESDINTVADYMTFITVFASGQNDGSTTDFESAPTLISSGNAGSTLDYGMGMSEGALHFNASNGSTLDARSTTTYNDNMPRIATGTREQGTSGEIALYVNSETVATGSSDSDDLNASSSFGIGNHPSGNVASQFQGDIAETLVFSDVLTSDERNRVESYLALKYGITRNGTDDTGTGSVDERDYRSSTSTVFWDYSLESGTFNNDLAGIGKDDNSCLLQTRSKSANSDAMVTMEIVSSFGSDDSFLMWGNNSSAIEASGTDVETISGIGSRLGREWFVQETGSVGTVEVTFDLSEVNGPSGEGTNNLTQVRLMVSSNSDFSSGVTTYSPTSFNSTTETVTFSVNWSDGDFFTLGSEETVALPVTLISFEATVQGDRSVELSWMTASELNNSFFTVERSLNGLDFEPIGYLDGAGTSNDVNEYQYTDVEPYDGPSYYRLKQTDFNGNFEHSELLKVVVEAQELNKIISIYPNPIATGELLQISGEFHLDTGLQITLLDLNGRAVKSSENIKQSGSAILTLDTHGLQPGLYLLLIEQNGHVPVKHRILIQ